MTQVAEAVTGRPTAPLVVRHSGDSKTIKGLNDLAPEMAAAADARLVWTGEDDRGIELDIVALDLNDAIVVVHVMPTLLRRR